MCIHVVPDWFFTLKQLQSTSGTLYSPVPALQTHTLMLGLLYSEIDFLSHKEPIYWKQEYVSHFILVWVLWAIYEVRIWHWIDIFPKLNWLHMRCYNIFSMIEYRISPCGVGGVDKVSSSDALGSGFDPHSVWKYYLLILTLKPLRLPGEPREWCHFLLLTKLIWGQRSVA